MRVHIAVPATVANLGPGFDILALALQLQNEVTAEERDGEPITIDAGDDAPDPLRDPATNLVVSAYRAAAGALGVSAKGAHFGCVNRIPMGRGLGSSSAAALAGVLAAVSLHQAPWDEQRVLDVVESVEGHRDNAAAALLGGLAICAPGAPSVNIEVPERLRAVVFTPDSELSTQRAREAVPHTFSRADAIFNAARCALLVRAMTCDDMDSLAVAMDDRWHQPARAHLVPAAAALMEAAMAAGAAGASLAGAGPSILALTVREPDGVAEAMNRAARSEGVAGSAVVYAIRNFGTRVDVRP